MSYLLLIDAFKPFVPVNVFLQRSLTVLVTTFYFLWYHFDWIIMIYDRNSPSLVIVVVFRVFELNCIVLFDLCVTLKISNHSFRLSKFGIQLSMIDLALWAFVRKTAFCQTLTFCFVRVSNETHTTSILAIHINLKSLNYWVETGPDSPSRRSVIGQALNANPFVDFKRAASA